MGNRGTKTRQCQKFERDLFYRPGDEEFQDIIKNVRRKLERHMAAAMQSKRKPWATCSRVTGALNITNANASENIPKKNSIVLWKLMNPQDQEWSLQRRKIMKSTLQALEKFDVALQFGAQVHSNAASDENSRCEGSSG